MVDKMAAVEVVGCEVHDVQGSTHRPLVADLKVLGL
jgi:hypothetical protein